MSPPRRPGKTCRTCFLRAPAPREYLPIGSSATSMPMKWTLARMAQTITRERLYGGDGDARGASPPIGQESFSGTCVSLTGAPGMRALCSGTGSGKQEAQRRPCAGAIADLAFSTLAFNDDAGQAKGIRSRSGAGLRRQYPEHPRPSRFRQRSIIAADYFQSFFG